MGLQDTLDHHGNSCVSLGWAHAITQCPRLSLEDRFVHWQSLVHRLNLMHQCINGRGKGSLRPTEVSISSPPRSPCGLSACLPPHQMQESPCLERPKPERRPSPRPGARETSIEPEAWPDALPGAPIPRPFVQTEPDRLLLLPRLRLLLARSRLGRRQDSLQPRPPGQVPAPRLWLRQVRRCSWHFTGWAPARAASHVEERAAPSRRA